MESESARAEAREASELQASQALLEDLESQYLTVKRQRDALQEQLKKAEDEVSSLNEKLAAQQELAKQGAERSHELALAQQQIKALKEEHTNVQERFDRSQKEADDLREEIRYELKGYCTFPWLMFHLTFSCRSCNVAD